MEVEIITIKRKGTTVQLSVDVRIPNYDDRAFTFSWHCGTGYEAYDGLLSAEIRKQLSDKIKAARRQAYEQGYKDGKGKQKKETRFSFLL